VPNATGQKQKKLSKRPNSGGFWKSDDIEVYDQVNDELRVASGIVHASALAVLHEEG